LALRSKYKGTQKAKGKNQKSNSKNGCNPHVVDLRPETSGRLPEVIWFHNPYFFFRRQVGGDQRSEVSRKGAKDAKAQRFLDKAELSLD